MQKPDSKLHQIERVGENNTHFYVTSTVTVCETRMHKFNVSVLFLLITVVFSLCDCQNATGDGILERIIEQVQQYTQQLNEIRQQPQQINEQQQQLSEQLQAQRESNQQFREQVKQQIKQLEQQQRQQIDQLEQQQRQQIDQLEQQQREQMMNHNEQNGQIIRQLAQLTELLQVSLSYVLTSLIKHGSSSQRKTRLLSRSQTEV